MAFQQLAGVALPYEQSRVAFAITRFITFQRLRFYNLLAYRDLVFLTLLPRQENRLFSVS